MPNPGIYNDALQKFRNEYNLPSYDLEKEIKSDLLDRIFNDKSSGTAAQQYERLAANTALIYFKSLTNIQASGTQKLKDFDYSKFITDFEALVQARYDSKLEDGVKGERTPFAGSDNEKLKAAINKSANKVNKPLAELWANQLKSGLLKIEDFRMTTTLLTNKLVDKNAKKEELGSVLRDFVAAREAVQKLRDSRKGIRGFFWRLFNGEQNKQEEDLLHVLDTSVKELDEFYGYDVESALHDATSVTPWQESKINAVKPSVEIIAENKENVNKENVNVNEENTNRKEFLDQLDKDVSLTSVENKSEQVKENENIVRKNVKE